MKKVCLIIIVQLSMATGLVALTQTTLNRYIKLTKNKNVRFAIRGISVLGGLGDRRAVPAIIQFLKNPLKKSFAWKAAYALGKMRERSAVPALIRSIQRGDSQTRIIAAQALGKIGDTRAVPALIKLFHSGDQMLKFSAILGLAMMPDIRARPVFLSALNSKKAKIRYWGILGLKQLASVKDTAILIKQTGDSDKEIRMIAIRILGGLRVRKSEMHILSLLKDDDRDIKTAAYISLLRLKNHKNNFKILIDQLKNRDPLIRSEAAYLLGDLKVRAAVLDLISCLKDEKSTVKLVVIAALEKIANRSAVSGLKALLKVSKGKVTIALLKALGKIGGDEAVATIVPFLSYGDYEIREIAQSSLLMNKKNLLFHFKRAYKKGYLRIRSAILIMIFLHLKDEKFVPFLLKELIESPLSTRDIIIRCLGEIGDSRATLYLIKNYVQSSKYADKIIYALGKIGDRRSIPFLILQLSTEDRRIMLPARQVLIKFGSSAIPFLIAASNDKKWRFRERIADLLGVIGDRDAVRVLRKLTRDSHVRVRNAAIRGLRLLKKNR